ncbi:LETM1 domain-containing protein 1-like [Dendronephthya gigantea]|uniref:LETM1 domain-containing protein 1-like n=1 Tax=Dendronephthya gigantea TaxID=151771 RepID=UPI00106C639B|nr:LETM1 domain-containing protein 1-like [Dendronephthya gigantea]
MAVNAASFVHKNCSRLTRNSFVNLSNLFYSNIFRCKHLGTLSTSNIFSLETGGRRHICTQGVTYGRLFKLDHLVFRCSSTDATTVAGRVQKFRKLLYDFYLGGKALFQDVKSTWKIRQKLRQNSWNYDVLQRSELWTMFKTQKNVKKTLPIIALSFLPVIGYLGPIIGFLRPRQFLSDHFWTEKQKKKFKALDSKERIECRNAIFHIIHEETKKPGNEEHQLLHKITARADLDDDAPFEKTFSAFSSGGFELNNLEHVHLKKLCSFWILRSLWPSFMLKRSLKNEMFVIHRDDIALAREGVETLDEKQLKEACHVRGLDTSHTSQEDLQIWLKSWLELTKDVSDNETSYLAHHAVFKALDVQETVNERSRSQVR